MNQAKWSSFPSVHSHLGPAMINFHFYSPSRPSHLCQYLLSDFGENLFPLDPYLTQGEGAGCLDGPGLPRMCALFPKWRCGFIPGRPTLWERGATPDLLQAPQGPRWANPPLMPAWEALQSSRGMWAPSSGNLSSRNSLLSLEPTCRNFGARGMAGEVWGWGGKRKRLRFLGILI